MCQQFNHIYLGVFVHITELTLLSLVQSRIQILNPRCGDSSQEEREHKVEGKKFIEQMVDCPLIFTVDNSVNKARFVFYTHSTKKMLYRDTKTFWGQLVMQLQEMLSVYSVK